MKRTRGAYTLLEMLSVIAAIVVLMALSSRHIRTLASDVPRSNRDFQVWIQTQDMLKQLKNDIEHSTQINVVNSDSPDGHKLLQLQQPQELVTYSLTTGSVLRQTDTSQADWNLSHVKIDWQIWDRNKNAYALEITTWTERAVLNKTREKFKQSFVYFQKTGSLNP